jgi:murein DD-endopeptidase MepM/ murein hydrolase activator NlpD
MSLLTGSRILLFAWNLRRLLVALGVGGLMVPLMFAGLVVDAAQRPAGHLVMPVQGATLTQPFGCTTLDIEPWSAECPTHHFHGGIDLAAPLETRIVAATAGTVVLGRERGGYGLYIVVRRDAKFSTLYGHLEWPLVQPGDVVAAGQAIALMGSTGNSTGPHLHFEVRVAGVPVDPLPLLGIKGGGT